jgi:hypothetical protein
MSEYTIIKAYGDTPISELQPRVSETYNKIIRPIPHCNVRDISFEGSQKPYEFFNAWITIGEKLMNEENPTMLEIGSFKGLWGMAFMEWCNLNNKRGEYCSVTWMQTNPANDDLLKVQKYYTDNGGSFKLVDANSQMVATKEEVLKFRDNYSFVFIDADHRYEGVKKDIELYSPLATKMLGFHDIRPKDMNTDVGVYKAIMDSGIVLDKEIVDDDNTMGIGIKFVS